MDKGTIKWSNNVWRLSTQRERDAASYGSTEQIMKQRIRLLSIVECGTHLFIIPKRTTGDDDNDEEGHVEPMVI